MLPPLWTQQPAPPVSGERWSCDLTSVAQLSQVRHQLRELLPTLGHRPDVTPVAVDQLVLAFDELASNALRHGQPPVRARITTTPTCWLLDVSDTATSRPPAEDTNRDLAAGGMGLYLIAAFATDHGWFLARGRKHVWASIPFTPEDPPEPVLPGQRVRRAAALD